MELRHLRYFVAVAERRNYRKAAEQLNLSQPALSSQIKDLEAELGVQLLERGPRGVRITDAGATLLEAARAILTRAHEAIVATREAAQGRRGQLRVGSLAAISPSFVAPSLARFRERFPDVEVTLVEMGQYAHIAALEAGEIQVGFSFGPNPNLPDTLQQQSLLTSQIKIMMGRRHRLARRTRVALTDLTQETMLCLSYGKRSNLHADQIRAIFSHHGVALGPIKYVDSFDSLHTLLASGRDITIMVQLAAASVSKEIVFKSLANTGPDLEVELRALWRAEESSQIVRNFVAVLAENGRRLTASGRDAKA